MDKIQTILDQVKDYSLNELSELVYQLKDIQSNKYRDTYKNINVYNGSGNITDKIHRDTNLQCYHVSSNIGGVGTNVIMIPLDRYTEELEKELIDKYTNV